MTVCMRVFLPFHWSMNAERDAFHDLRKTAIEFDSAQDTISKQKIGYYGIINRKEKKNTITKNGERMRCASATVVSISSAVSVQWLIDFLCSFFPFDVHNERARAQTRSLRSPASRHRTSSSSSAIFGDLTKRRLLE